MNTKLLGVPGKSLLIATLGLWASLVSPSTAAQLDGRVLLGELNCVACHQATDTQAAWLSPKAAPRLAGIGSRTSPEWLQKHLAAPHTTMPGTTMPDVLHGLPSAEKTAAAEALTHYLVSLDQAAFRKVMPDRAATSRGEKLFHSVGCVACHAPQNTTTNISAAAPLPKMADKWTVDGLQLFLKDPLASRPSGRMPAMNLADGEAFEIAHYLLRDTKVPATVEVAQYRGRMRSFEDLETGELARTGPAANFTLEAMGRDRGYALRFTSWLRVDQAGEYTFHLAATGASKLSVRGQWIIGEDSWQREQVDGKRAMRLNAGLHPVVLDYVQRGSKEPALQLEWEGPGIAREVIPTSRLQSLRETVPAPVPFVIDSSKAAQGRALYAQMNCAVCHESKPSQNPPPALSSLQTSRGCLAENPSAKAPDYHLTGSQRTALREAIASLNQAGLGAPSQQQRLAHTMTSLNCAACHSRDGVGGVTTERDPYFTSNGEDLGEEGRVPPRLDGVGDRLRPAWLSNLLATGASVRPYVNTRMPQFGYTNIGHLTDLFVSLDRRAQPVKPSPDAVDIQKEAGRRLVGTDGLSCIACHRFNRQPAHALQVVDLTTTTERLNEDWFRQFLLDPNRFHPGTRMPALWPDGVSPLTSVLGGNTERQHAALWTYLADGPRTKFPEGLSRQNVELIVGGEPVVYRGKLWEAGFRGIAAGYPAQLNMAFDSEEMRLALLWRGRFLNAGAHWGVQGMGNIRPLGTDVVVFPHGPPLAVLAGTATPWPTGSSKEAGMKFDGLQLDTFKRPTLLYSVRSVGIEDFVSPTEVGGKAGLHRTVKFTGSPPAGLHFRLANGKLTTVGENAWRLDETLTIRVIGGAKAFVRGDGDRQELLVPIVARVGNNQLEVDYVW